MATQQSSEDTVGKLLPWASEWRDLTDSWVGHKGALGRKQHHEKPEHSQAAKSSQHHMSVAGTKVLKPYLRTNLSLNIPFRMSESSPTARHDPERGSGWSLKVCKTAETFVWGSTRTQLARLYQKLSKAPITSGHAGMSMKGPKEAPASASSPDYPSTLHHCFPWPDLCLLSKGTNTGNSVTVVKEDARMFMHNKSQQGPEPPRLAVTRCGSYQPSPACTAVETEASASH